MTLALGGVHRLPDFPNEQVAFEQQQKTEVPNEKIKRRTRCRVQTPNDADTE